MQQDSYDVYSGEELKVWADRRKILLQEKYLLDKYVVDVDANIIEAGTGGGRLSLYLYDRGFRNILAFDFVDEMVSRAKRKNDQIDFICADATRLDGIEGGQFDYAIYLQQIISLVSREKIGTALSESVRVLKDGGVVIYSFLDYRGRIINPLVSGVVNCSRIVRREPVDRKYLPWLRLDGKPNWWFFSSGQACAYWFDREEIIGLIQDLGLTILEIATSADILGRFESGMLYIVCKK